MAIGDPYADVGALVDRLGVTDPPLMTNELLDAASRAVEAFCRRQFNKATTATARRFRPLDWQRLPVDDFHTTTGLVVDVDGTGWAALNFDPQPWNGMVDGQLGWPFFNLYAVGRRWSPTATITVTAQWGWSAVPSAIVMATLDVAAAMHLGSGGSGPVQSESVAGYSVSYNVGGLGNLPDSDTPAELRKALPYRRKRFGVA